MLRRVTEIETDKLQEVLNFEPESNVRLAALVKAYGIGRQFFNVWQSGWETVLARFETSFFINANEDADFEEIAFFLKFNPYFRRLSGKADAVLKLKNFIGGCKSLDFDFMTCVMQTYSGGKYEIETSPGLKAVYEVMEKARSAEFSVGKFVPWYADVSHRIRHGCARAFLLRVNEKPVSACIVSAESDKAGLISGVATVPEFRKNGFASAVVEKACRELINCGKRPVLECLPPLSNYYERLGFKKTGNASVLESGTDII